MTDVDLTNDPDDDVQPGIPHEPWDDDAPEEVPLDVPEDEKP